MGPNALLTAFVTLLVTVDPLGLAPIFLAVTSRIDHSLRPIIAWEAGLIAFLVLAFFAFFGETVISALGISLPALRIAGGLLLFWISFEMVFETRVERKQDSAHVSRNRQHGRDLAVFPLGVPLIAGPAAITAVILISSRLDGSLSSKALLLGLIAVVTGGCSLTFLVAAQIGRLLGQIGIVVFSRVLGVLLAALSVQFVLDGISSVFRV